MKSKEVLYMKKEDKNQKMISKETQEKERIVSYVSRTLDQGMQTI
jgi:hypothetical protein